MACLVRIRAMEANDINKVSSVCINAFSKSIANSLPKNGVLIFSKLASSEAFLKRMQDGNLILVAEYKGKVEGVIELIDGRHIAMFFVEPCLQNQGIGRKLLSTAISFSKVDTITVKASLPSVYVYKKFGFKSEGKINKSTDLVYQLMKLKLSHI